MKQRKKGKRAGAKKKNRRTKWNRIFALWNDCIRNIGRYLCQRNTMDDCQQGCGGSSNNSQDETPSYKYFMTKHTNDSEICIQPHNIKVHSVCGVCVCFFFSVGRSVVFGAHQNSNSVQDYHGIYLLFYCYCFKRYAQPSKATSKMMPNYVRSMLMFNPSECITCLRWCAGFADGT